MPAKKNLPLQSMTGFARAEAELTTEAGSFSWNWELRSLNSKGLDLKCRLPSWLESLEPELRKFVKGVISRGSVHVGLQLRSETNSQQIQLNEEALTQVIAAAEQARKKIPDASPPSIDGILSLRGVLSFEDLELSEESREALTKVLLESFQTALDMLVRSRQSEGEKIGEVLREQLEEVARLASAAKKSAEAVPEMLKQRLESQIMELTSQNLPEERLVQEVALLAVKADVREELDRLVAHIEAGNDLLGEGSSVGRRFDFLIQEFNREANTLCSKAQTIELKKIGLDLKTVVDQMREQVQNIA